jgi:hypothetical protein
VDPRLKKFFLKHELAALLAVDMETLERAQRAAVDAATHDEAKPGNDEPRTPCDGLTGNRRERPKPRAGERGVLRVF